MFLVEIPIVFMALFLATNFFLVVLTFLGRLSMGELMRFQMFT
jgi:hypothetical protein